MKKDHRIILLISVFALIALIMCSKRIVSQEYSSWIKVKAEITAYVPVTPRHGKYNDGQTALGDDANKLDGVAVDPDVIPYRSKIYIPGVGVKEADDTGGAMRNADRILIDLRVRNTRVARQWGRKTKWIWVKLRD